MRVSGVSQVDRNSDFASCVPANCVGRGLNKGTMVHARSSVLKRAAPPALALNSNNSVPLLMSLALFEPLCLSLSLGAVVVSKIS